MLRQQYGYDKERYNSCQRSPSRRRISSIRRKGKEEDDKEPLSITPAEIDELIEKWNTTREEARALEQKQKKYRKLIGKIMNITEADVIKGKELQVIRKIQKRRTINRSDLPPDIFDQYSNTKNIEMYYIQECPQ